jgi:enoyl-CoA hydratase
MMLNTDKMIASKDGHIGLMVFNNPERRNAVSYEMRVAALSILDDFENDPSVRVIIMKGAGDRSFVSGSDISQFEQRMSDTAAQAAAVEIGARLQVRYETLTKPLIAMVQGYCLGAGLSTALQADLRVAADNAVFGIPAARLGLAYAFHNTKRLVEVIGPARTSEMLFTARRYTASEALAMGLVTRIVPHSQLEDEVRTLAESIITNAPLSVRAAKLMVKEALKALPDRRFCAQVEAECHSSQDHAEGRRAFMEKREPRFVGM